MSAYRAMLRISTRIVIYVQTRSCVKTSVCSGALRATSTYPFFYIKPMAEPQQSTIYKAPPEVRGMTSLDREAFTQTVVVPALRVPKGVLNKVVKSLKKSIIQRPNVPRVIKDKENGGETDDLPLVLLDPNRVTSSSSFSEAETEALRSFGVSQELQHFELRLAYVNLKSEEILRAVLPEGQDVTTSFSRVGHIIHMNLRDHQLPYKNLIGQVIMDKNPGVTCVVNKTNIIDTTYRYFKMELLAGEENMVAKVRENGMTFEFDFSHVYWNPRLSTEHERLVNLVNRGDTLLDVFAGVGPFAIPAARRGAAVLANDLNPESYRWLQHNCKLNKVQSKVRTFNLDGRAFIQGPLKQELPTLLKGTASVHVVMNLPALALEFLDAFRGLLNQELSCVENLPIVHCYGFSKDDDPKKDMVERASTSLGFSLEGRCSVHFVRNVAPNKEMMCVSFTLPREALFSKDSEKTEPSEEPASKRQKCEENTD